MKALLQRVTKSSVTINEKMFSFDGKKIESISDTKGMANYMKSILNGGSTNNVIRVCGYLTDNLKKQIWFNPSSTWVKHS